MAASWIFDPTVSGVAAAAVGIPLALISIESLRWTRRAAELERERASVQRLYSERYKARPTSDVYPFASPFALRRRVRTRRSRFAQRAQLARGLPTSEYDRGERLAREWLATVGQFAKSAAIERVPLRRFMQTYHLGVIREGLLVSPILINEFASERLDEQDQLLAFWGMALVELAARYNSLAPQQRQAVFADSEGITYGPLLRYPSRWAVPYWAVRNRFSPRLVLRRRHLRSARRLYLAVATGLT